MSLAYRIALTSNPHLVFTNPSQKADLLDQNKTKSDLCLLLGDLLQKGFIIGLTAVKSDHHDDSGLGVHCHFNGYCADCWPMNSTKPGDWMDQNDPRFAQFCHAAAIDPIDHQVGLGGSALTHAAITAAGSGFFVDNGSDHVHLGVL